jgi:hypothetical protein
MIIDPIYMIEGIGSTLGLAELIYCPFEYTTTLICYHYKNFQFGAISNIHCDPHLDIFETNPLKIIYPVSSNAYYLKNPDNNLIKITTYDMLGKFISEKTFIESGILDYTDVTSGVYFMYIEYNGQPIKPYKFMVQN